MPKAGKHISLGLGEESPPYMMPVMPGAWPDAVGNPSLLQQQVGGHNLFRRLRKTSPPAAEQATIP